MSYQVLVVTDQGRVLEGLFHFDQLSTKQVDELLLLNYCENNHEKTSSLKEKIDNMEAGPSKVGLTTLLNLVSSLEEEYCFAVIEEDGV